MHFDLIKKHLPTEDVVIVLDNEPRSKTNIDQLTKAVARGYKVCVWPSHIEYKDINDMVMGGISAEDITKIILENAHKGLSAKVKFQEWKKV